MTCSNSSQQVQICYKSLQIYQNLIAYMNDKEMPTEPDAKGMFSSEDQTNVRIPCALSATTFELYVNFQMILKNNRILAPKVKMYEVLSELVKVRPEFVYTMNRLNEDFIPPILLIFQIVDPN